MVDLTKCDSCLNSRIVVSENGLKSICCLSEKKAVNCLTGEEDGYKGFPPRRKDGE